MKKSFFIAILAFNAVVALGATGKSTDNTQRLWYDRPATVWLEALPLGNSRLGAMVYGGTETEEIQLNESNSTKRLSGVVVLTTTTVLLRCNDSQRCVALFLMARKRKPRTSSTVISSKVLMACVS